jgi:hypothetical protein
MTQVLEVPSLFEALPDGGYLMPEERPPESQGSAYTARQWQEGQGRFLRQGERALAEVAPDSISMVERAGRLTLALDAISQSNQDRGFAVAAASGLHRERVEPFAGAGTDAVARQKMTDARRGREQARRQFFAANGLGELAIAHSDSLTPQQRIARRAMNERWAAFEKEFGGSGPAAHTRRNAYMRQLAVYTSRAETTV